MEYKYISSKFTLQTQTNYKSTKIQTCLHGPFPRDISFQSSVKKYIPPKCLNTAKIQTLEKCYFSIIKKYTVVRGGSRTPATSTNRDICCNG